ncbi:Putative transposase of IS4/5 family [Mesorhizobium albiziae]|uniref:Transposase of IS4/5 family n=1 Tax=Neomesorhizobium albiziae TaxID=335020 RepID=A0A1I4F9Q2_9HYPH|nr:hypothetical protein GCM10007937_10940 [Mesorhizobium albiziae]SFL13536.1 Putative transposase of IS4/5 family [Mesorhizobium albiziae]
MVSPRSTNWPVGPEPRNIRYELTDCEWNVIKPLLPDNPHGAPRVNDRHALNGNFWALRSVHRGVNRPLKG